MVHKGIVRFQNIKGYNEPNTKGSLIEPIRQALEWAACLGRHLHNFTEQGSKYSEIVWFCSNPFTSTVETQKSLGWYMGRKHNKRRGRRSPGSASPPTQPESGTAAHSVSAPVGQAGTVTENPTGVQSTQSLVKTGALRQHAIGSIQAAYAGLFAWSLLRLLAEVVLWSIALFRNSGNATDRNHVFLGWIICVSLFAAIFQFARIYYYIHEFDSRHDDDRHFIHHLSQHKGSRIGDRSLRWLAGIIVICAVEKLGAENLHEHWRKVIDNPIDNSQLLIPFAVLCVVTFALLGAWDINLWLWLKKHKETMDSDAQESLNRYDPFLKRIQRATGLAFSVVLCIALAAPSDSACIFFWGGFMLLFVLAWVVDYSPPRVRPWIERGASLDGPGGNILRELFGSVVTILRLFESVAKARVVHQHGTKV